MFLLVEHSLPQDLLQAALLLAVEDFVVLEALVFVMFFPLYNKKSNKCK